MTSRTWFAKLILSAFTVGLIAPSLQADDLFWQGGAGTLFDSNYTDGTTGNQIPDSTDVVNLGAAGVVTLSVPDVNPYSFQKLRVGMDGSSNIPLPAGVTGGTGELTVSGGARIDLTAGASGNPSAGLWVGRAANGTLTIDGAGSSVTSNQLIVIGYGIANSQTGQSGTVHIKNGGELIVTAGNINLGAGSQNALNTSGNPAVGGNGMQGHLILESGAVRILEATANLSIGERRATSSVVVSGGEFVVGDDAEIGLLSNNGTGDQAGSFLTISGGTFTTGGDLEVGLGENTTTVGNQGSTDATLNVSGTGHLTVGTKTVGPGPDPNFSLSVGLEESINATANISGGIVDVMFNFWVGRGSSTGSTVNLTGGTVNVDRFLLIGSSSATGVAFNHSGGEMNLTVNDFRVADGGTTDATYNLSGDGVLNTVTGGIVGRQGTGTFNQTGGTANLGGTLWVGKREGTNPASGLYKISDGELTAGANNGGTALSIASNDEGEFRVVGEDAAINLLGNFALGNTVDGMGTLAFELEAGESLSMINVGDGVTPTTATFALGTSLLLDDTIAPGLTSYDLLTATDIIDEGLAFTGPAGWTHSIVSGGLGEILRVSAPGSGEEDADFDQDGDVDGADFLTWQRNVATNPATQAQGDANNDTVVSSSDLAIWEGQFGASVAASAPAPEPSSFVLVFAAAGLIAAARVRRAKHGA